MLSIFLTSSSELLEMGTWHWVTLVMHKEMKQLTWQNLGPGMTGEMHVAVFDHAWVVTGLSQSHGVSSTQTQKSIL